MRLLPPLSQQPVRRFARPEWVLKPGLRYYAAIETEVGRLLLFLFPEHAPRTVNAFVFLARHRFYDGLFWHRVVPGYVVQTGDPTGTGEGHAGFFFPLEAGPGATFDDLGWAGIARRKGDFRGSSQFFLTLAPAKKLDCRYTRFGRVVEGRDLLARISEGDRIARLVILVEEA